MTLLRAFERLASCLGSEINCARNGESTKGGERIESTGKVLSAIGTRRSISSGIKEACGILRKKRGYR